MVLRIILLMVMPLMMIGQTKMDHARGLCCSAKADSYSRANILHDEIQEDRMIKEILTVTSEIAKLISSKNSNPNSKVRALNRLGKKYLKLKKEYKKGNLNETEWYEFQRMYFKLKLD